MFSTIEYERGMRIAGTDCVHSDFLGCEFASHRPRHLKHSRFTGIVRLLKLTRWYLGAGGFLLSNAGSVSVGKFCLFNIAINSHSNAPY